MFGRVYTREERRCQKVTGVARFSGQYSGTKKIDFPVWYSMLGGGGGGIETRYFTLQRGHEQVLGDLSMTLCDPYAVNFLASSAVKIALHLINGESMPRDNPVLILLLRMLALGLSAWQMIESQDFKEPKLDAQIVTKFLPALMSLMVDDQIRQLNSKLPPDERASAIAIIEHSGPPPDACQAYSQLSGVAAVLSMYYALHVGGVASGVSAAGVASGGIHSNAGGKARGDARGLMRVLATLPNCQAQRAFEDPFLHTLVSTR